MYIVAIGVHMSNYDNRAASIHVAIEGVVHCYSLYDHSLCVSVSYKGKPIYTHNSIKNYWQMPLYKIS